MKGQHFKLGGRVFKSSGDPMKDYLKIRELYPDVEDSYVQTSLTKLYPTAQFGKPAATQSSGAAKQPSAQEGAQESPISLLDRLKTSFGNAEGSADYLKAKGLNASVKDGEAVVDGAPIDPDSVQGLLKLGMPGLAISDPKKALNQVAQMSGDIPEELADFPAELLNAIPGGTYAKHGIGKMLGTYKNPENFSGNDSLEEVTKLLTLAMPVGANKVSASTTAVKNKGKEALETVTNKLKDWRVPQRMYGHGTGLFKNKTFKGLPQEEKAELLNKYLGELPAGKTLPTVAEAKHKAANEALEQAEKSAPAVTQKQLESLLKENVGKQSAALEISEQDSVWKKAISKLNKLASKRGSPQNFSTGKMIDKSLPEDDILKPAYEKAKADWESANIIPDKSVPDSLKASRAEWTGGVVREDPAAEVTGTKFLPFDEWKKTEAVRYQKLGPSEETYADIAIPTAELSQQKRNILNKPGIAKSYGNEGASKPISEGEKSALRALADTYRDAERHATQGALEGLNAEQKAYSILDEALKEDADRAFMQNPLASKFMGGTIGAISGMPGGLPGTITGAVVGGLADKPMAQAGRSVARNLAGKLYNYKALPEEAINVSADPATLLALKQLLESSF